MRLSKPFIVSMLALLGVLFCAPSASASSGSAAYPFYASDDNAGSFWTEEKFADILNQINFINSTQYSYMAVNCDNGSAIGTNAGLVYVSTAPFDSCYISSDWILQKTSQDNTFPYYGMTGKVYLIRFNNDWSVSSISVGWDSFPERLTSWRCYGLVTNFDFEYEQSILHVTDFYKKVISLDDPTLQNEDLIHDSLRSHVQGLFKCSYFDSDLGKEFPVKYASKWYKKNGSLDTEIIQLVIVDSSNSGYSDNGYFKFTPRGVGENYSMTDLKLDIATLDYSTDPDFILPTVDNSYNSNFIDFMLYGEDENEEITHTPFPYFATNSNRFNFDIGFGDYRYKGFRYTFNLDSFSPNTVQSFDIRSLYYSPYNVRENTFIFDLEFTGPVEKTVVDNTKDDDDTVSVPPASWTGQNVYSGFNIDYDYSPDYNALENFLSVVFDQWVVNLLIVGFSIALVGYVIYGKHGF